LTTKELALTDGLNEKLSIASAACGLSSHEFVLAAVGAALETVAESDERLNRVFTAIDKREVPS
jgi:hypothetical protein